MMEFPVLVYRCPGAHFGPNGTTYESMGVNDESQLMDAVQDGWSKTLVEAVIEFIEPKEVSNSAPTREEILQQADKIGLKIDGRWSDAKLIEKINEAMKLS